MPTIRCNTVVAPLIGLALVPATACAEYYFDPALLQGSDFGKSLDLDRFNQRDNALPTGDYVLDVYLNNQLIRRQASIALVKPKGDKTDVQPCLSPELIALSAIRTTQNVTPNICLPIDALGPKINWEVDLSSLRLNMVVPQAGLLHSPRGFIPVSEWDAGETALFLRHNTNFYHTENTDSHLRYDYLWSNINAGFNLGLWQVRHQGNLRYADDNQTGRHYKYNAVATSVQRPLPQLDSIIAFGDNYTNSSLFGNLSFNGVKLSTDQRMWPQGKRGYAPEVRGVATTTARVVVRQQGKVIYETTVAPGAFVINDLYNTRGQGDLTVDVVEANGQVSRFTVPYSAVPDSIRPGNWNYELAMGYVRQYYSVENKFIEGVLQRGMSNVLTANMGSRLADNYQAFLAGGVLATSVGAFGLNTVFSSAHVENNEKQQGWRVEASYSKTFTTGTNLVLAAYRYSTSGYRDLQDVLGVRRQEKNGTLYYSDTLNQRNNFSATVSQPMGDWGMLSFTGSTSDYYNNASRITQLQLGYSNSWRDISFNISAARQRSTYSSRYFNSVNDRDFDNENQRKYTENTVSLGISIPFDFGSSRSQINFDMNRSRDSRTATVGMSGTTGEKSSTSWALYSGIEHNNDSGDSSTWGGNIEHRTSVGAFRAYASRGDSYQQYGLGMSGTLVAHRGGITAGPYTSDTFALVEAPGARGAKIRNGQGATVDRFGYAILPSLTPYRYNTISLDSQNMADDVELQGGSKRLVPYAGAISRVTFKTTHGKATLINTTLPDSSQPPMGADVTDSNGEAVGIMGQGGQIYARLAAQSGVLFVKWGKTAAQQCQVWYQLPTTRDAPLYQLTLPCRQE
ncbi:TPA: fimbrial outer membrane usher protein [Citrobacter amalonaticus]|uniref:fimbrial outer membrane usher protein n=1 Tax=Citrobacter amalonaticus TaxID=35703 RepID=UPI000F68C2C4|nr:fimbrial outer membrane usher protein [Citrobacter amalonaticus]QDK87250.1 fimbrial outer membrane usher protein [Citrobacter amalonaticus]RSC56789.1 fimbrial outer membrane usher protein [Citrobacter amalonaticus]HBU6573918.1 fimbrial outer membrane usher protein [Citrobacter amalonaticus]HCB1823869.1 fimbrial outer membrane usher protein [Citrobacter amalonaticus]HCB1902921.1 fimbrial outer membrane usher protein [Citrobacter amalonaticus]